MTEYTGTCSLPPSVNRMYRAVGKDKKLPTRGDRFRSPEYRAWATLACYELGRRKKALDGPVQVFVLVGKCYRARDLDGMLKAILDCIVSLGWIKDDNIMVVETVGIAYAPDRVPDGKCEITVQAVPVEAAGAPVKGRVAA